MDNTSCTPMHVDCPNENNSKQVRDNNNSFIDPCVHQNDSDATGTEKKMVEGDSVVHKVNETEVTSSLPPDSAGSSKSETENCNVPVLTEDNAKKMTIEKNLALIDSLIAAAVDSEQQLQHHQQNTDGNQKAEKNDAPDQNAGQDDEVQKNEPAGEESTTCNDDESKTAQIGDIQEADHSAETENEEEENEIVVPSGGDVWSLNQDKKTSNKFWWNSTYSISIWHNSLKELSGIELMEIDDTAVWAAYLHFQVATVYKICAICRAPEQNDDFKICCYCGATVHVGSCSGPASAGQMAWKDANKGFEAALVVCNACDDVKKDPPPLKRVPDNARRATLRSLTIAEEYPRHISIKLHRIARHFETGKKISADKNAELLQKTRTAVAEYFQPHNTRDLMQRVPISSKGGGVGVRAAVDIPRFTIIGVYPGYEDPLSGDHARHGRPGPKYSLVDLNCADYFNDVFTEFDMCLTPFLNEPNPEENANCGWIQEGTMPDRRLSVMTCRDIKAGEELMIGYGPMYPRTYPYKYDALAFHPVDGFSDPPCYSLWHWTSLEEKDANFVAYVGYDFDTDLYTYWETEDEEKKAELEKAMSSKPPPRVT